MKSQGRVSCWTRSLLFWLGWLDIIFSVSAYFHPNARFLFSGMFSYTWIFFKGMPRIWTQVLHLQNESSYSLSCFTGLWVFESMKISSTKLLKRPFSPTLFLLNRFLYCKELIQQIGGTQSIHITKPGLFLDDKSKALSLSYLIRMYLYTQDSCLYQIICSNNMSYDTCLLSSAFSCLSSWGMPH